MTKSPGGPFLKSFGAVLALTMCGAASTLAFADVSSAKSIGFTIRVIGQGSYAGHVVGDAGNQNFALPKGADGNPTGSFTLTLAPASDGRDDRDIIVSPAGRPKANDLPISIVAYAAPDTLSFDFPDTSAINCGSKIDGNGGEAFWVAQFLRARARLTACLAQGDQSQNTIIATTIVLFALNRLNDLHPAIYNANNQILMDAKTLESSADLCRTNPNSACARLKQQIILGDVSDYKLLIVGQSIEAKADQLSDEELFSAITDVQAGQDAFTRCDSGDYKGQCGDLHTRKPMYIQTISRLCAIAGKRSSAIFSGVCKP